MDNSPSQPSPPWISSSTSFYFGAAHPLAAVAARHCAAHAEDLPRSHHLGRVACGACWELAIRDDERAVVEFGLPRELVADPNLVDEIAVELACAGRPVELTGPELLAAVLHLSGRGLNHCQIGERLGISDDMVAARLLQYVARDEAA